MSKRVLLADIAHVRAGRTVDRKARRDAGVPVYGLDQVTGRRPEMPPCIPEADLRAAVPRLRAGDVVVALIGKAGRCAVVTAAHDGAALDRECVAVRVREPDGPVSQSWLEAWARSSDFRAQLEPLVRGTIPRVSSRDIGSLKVPITPRGHQHRTAEELARLDAAVTAARRTLDVLEHLRSATIDLGVYGEPSDER